MSRGAIDALDRQLRLPTEGNRVGEGMARLSSGRSVVSGKLGMFWGPMSMAW